MVGDFDPDEQVRRGIRFLGAKYDKRTGDFVGVPIVGGTAAKWDDDGPDED